MPPLLRIVAVHKRFKERAVLQGIDLDVAPSEKLVIIGASGSGKTTLLRCIVGLETIDSGRIYLSDRCLTHVQRNDSWISATHDQVRRACQPIGIVFQQFNLFPHMTAIENVTLAPMRVLGLSRAEAFDEGTSLLARVGLSGHANSYPSQLSGGQQQRVAIARALAVHPRLLLFDEVTSALDPELVGEVLEVMHKLATDGMTMIVVTHEMGFARSVADRLIFMDGGSVVETGAPNDVLRNPQNERTRSFLRAVLEH